MGEEGFGHDLKRSGRGLMDVLSPHLPGGTEKTTKKYFNIVYILTDIRINHVRNTVKKP
jgi:hypothetical protein